MTDIIERLKEPEAHYPGNFDTPKRANAMLSCLCQEAMEEVESLRRELAEANAEIERLKLSPPEKREDLRCVISDLCDQVRERDEQLAASQAREVQLREALEAVKPHVQCDPYAVIIRAIALPQDTTALEAMITKAGEVMRERCAVECETHYNFSNALAAAIRALPAVTLEDLKCSN